MPLPIYTAGGRHARLSRNRSTPRERCLSRQREAQEYLKETLRSHDLKHNFIYALTEHARGNSEFLTDYLRSDRPLGELEREHLAQVLEGVLDRETLRGRPPNSDERTAAMLAHALYKIWRDENKRARVRDYGACDAMKDEMVRFVIQDLEPNSPPLNCETVRQLMDRPRSRRKF